MDASIHWLTQLRKHADLEADKKQALTDAVTELREAAALYEPDAKKLRKNLAAFVQKHAKALPHKNRCPARGAQGVRLPSADADPRSRQAGGPALQARGAGGGAGRLNSRLTMRSPPPTTDARRAGS